MSTILERAAAIVDGDREQTYGDPGKNLRTIADLWDSWLLARGYSGPGLTTDDVAALMVLLKIARLANDPTHLDSATDACGYLRLMERVQEAGKPAPSLGGLNSVPGEAVDLQTCACRWRFGIQVQKCALHDAHIEAVHEWAARAKEAEARLDASNPSPAPSMDASLPPFPIADEV